MEEMEVVLERHAQQILTLERDMADMKTVQAEIRSMNDSVCLLSRQYVPSGIAVIWTMILTGVAAP